VSEAPSISVVIATYGRKADCRRAVTSALEGELEPVEVLVCDDASTDGTEEEIRAWAEEEPRLTYLRLAQNHGGPCPARNAGIRSARGDWIAVLDDDDRFKPEKLAIQAEYISTGLYDVIGSDADRSSGGAYFGLAEPKEPDLDEMLVHNPIIVSTAVVRRSLLLEAGGFPEQVGPLRLKAAGDYALWLSLATRGARVVIAPERLISYADDGDDRLSSSIFRFETEIAAVKSRLWTRHPRDPSVLRSALRANADAARWGLRSLRRD
jgi:glycosyltransferase involved in cell wall biosynthesis